MTATSWTTTSDTIATSLHALASHLGGHDLPITTIHLAGLSTSVEVPGPAALAAWVTSLGGVTVTAVGATPAHPGALHHLIELPGRPLRVWCTSPRPGWPHGTRLTLRELSRLAAAA